MENSQQQVWVSMWSYKKSMHATCVFVHVRTELLQNPPPGNNILQNPQHITDYYRVHHLVITDY